MSFNNLVFKWQTFLTLKKRVFFYSLLIALIMTIFTPHLYIDSKYWGSKILMPRYSPVYLIIENNEVGNDANIYNAVDILNFSNLNKNVELKKQKNGKFRISYRYDFVIYPTYREYDSINFKSNIDGNVRLIFRDEIFIKSLNVNGDESLRETQLSDNSNKYYSFKVLKNENVNLKIKAKQTYINADLLINRDLLKF